MTRMPVGRNGVRPLRSEEPPSGGCSGGLSTFADLRDGFAFQGAFIGRSARFSRSTKSSISNCKGTFELNDALRHWHRSIKPMPSGFVPADRPLILRLISTAHLLLECSTHVDYPLALPRKARVNPSSLSHLRRDRE